MKPTLYLDIDGVILANENNASNYADEFIAYVVTNYAVTWLTTHCMDGNAATPIEHVGHLFKPETVELMRQIRGAKWSLLKTEAIDFTKPFLWIDDDCYIEEREVLNRHTAFANWIEIDLSKNENQLKDLLDSFPAAIQPTAPIAPNM